MKVWDALWALGALIALYVVYQQTDSELAVGLLGSFAAVWGIALQFRISRQKEAEARLFPQKAEAYEDLIKLISEMFQQQKKRAGTDINAASERLVRIRTNLIIWGSAKTIQALDNLGEPTEHQSGKQLIERLARLYAAIRNDLGHDDSLGASRMIALGHLIPEDRQKFQ